MLFVFLLILALTVRSTRLLVDDSITRPFRDRLEAASMKGATLNPDGTFERPRSAKIALWFHQLFGCPWCMSVWTAAASTTLIALGTPASAPLVVWIALAAGASYCAALLSLLVYKLDDQ